MHTKLLNQIKRHEGLRLFPYHCTANKLTIGYGRNIEDVGISEQEAEYLLMNDLKQCEEAIETVTSSLNLNQARKDVLTNMCFQLGFKGTMKFKKMFEALVDEDYDRAANEMLDSRWAKQTPNRANELAEQMRRGEYL